MLDPAVAYVNVINAYPDTEGINASGPSTTDGFEFIADFVNDNNLGPMQMILNHAGLTPNGVVESDAASQIKEALWKGFGGAPGTVEQWHLAADPGTTGHRCLFLNGQGILRANYPLLDAACYVGDGNNAAVAAAGGGYYRADDAAGTIPNIVGVYLILPETRGYVPRGLDLAASVDPDGASRYLGDPQAAAMLTHNHRLASNSSSFSSAGGYGAGVFPTNYADGVGSAMASAQPGDSGTYFDVDKASNQLVEDSGTTTDNRGANFSSKFVVWY